MKINYFAYGSNMDSQRMKQRGVSFLSRKKAFLKNWKLVFNKVASKNPNEGYANIIEKNGGAVEGIVYEIDEGELKKLDSYEGCPLHYFRKSIIIEIEQNKKEAIAYIANPHQTKDGLKPSKDYLKHLINGTDILSEDYKEKLKNTKTLD